ncbi:hypothetical protein BC940DRAFT_306628 [Gongronella butleri]|nr:hypothetical protein BC940DRAFT_306628 [Gongronella butleri]
MADGTCVAMYSQASHDEPIPTTSSFRRLSHGAHYLRRLSRSFSHDAGSVAPPSSTTEARRRLTIASTPSDSAAPLSPSSANSRNEANSKLHVRIVPNIENPSRSLIFDIFDRDLEPGVFIKVGRFTDRSHSPTHMSFKSKVVSRSHCEFWMEHGKLFIRDTRSSSGTFLNHLRISPPNQESQPMEIKDGDMVQLGVDYQGGIEEIYRSVKMRFEVNRVRRQRPLSFNMTAFQNIRNLTSSGSQIQDQTADLAASSPPDTASASASAIEEQQQQPLAAPDHPPLDNDHVISSSSCYSDIQSNMAGVEQQQQQQQVNASSCHAIDQVEECCICLYALAPYQALFVSPCAHTYHYKCIRPLLESYPGFQCPICRTYSDLDANTNLEAEEVLEKYGLHRQTTITESSQRHILSSDSQLPQRQAPQEAHSCQHINSPVSPVPMAGHDPFGAIALTDAAARDRRTVIVPEAVVVASVGAIAMEREAQDAANARADEQDAERAPNQHGSNSATADAPAVYPHDAMDEDGDALMLPSTSNASTPPCLMENQPQTPIDARDALEDAPERDSSSFVVIEPSSPVSNAPAAVSTVAGTAEEAIMSSHRQNPPSSRDATMDPTSRRRGSATGFVEKLKMVFFEKRKSSGAVVPRERKRSNRPRPLSYPNFLMRRHDDDDDENDDDFETHSNASDHDHARETRPPVPPLSDLSAFSAASSAGPAHGSNTSSSIVVSSQTLSRQSTTHLPEIEEVDEFAWQQHRRQYQPMSVDG